MVGVACVELAPGSWRYVGPRRVGKLPCSLLGIPFGAPDELSPWLALRHRLGNFRGHDEQGDDYGVLLIVEVGLEQLQ